MKNTYNVGDLVWMEENRLVRILKIYKDGNVLVAVSNKPNEITHITLLRKNGKKEYL